jgi:hypothetical protein
MGFALQSVSPPWSRTPFGAAALMLFSASRTFALRTRSSRCPAAPGRCSPRRSVPSADRGPHRPMLSWAVFASPERSPHGTHPASRAHPSCASTLPAAGVGGGGAPGAWHAYGQEGPSRDPPALLRFSTRTCPRFLPMTVASCRINPTGSEWASGVGHRGVEPRAPGLPKERQRIAVKRPPAPLL